MVAHFKKTNKGFIPKACKSRGELGLNTEQKGGPVLHKFIGPQSIPPLLGRRLRTEGAHYFAEG